MPTVYPYPRQENSWLVHGLVLLKHCKSNSGDKHLFTYLFIYCHLYSAFSIVQCSNALYRL